jgi:hypothetical protein
MLNMWGGMIFNFMFSIAINISNKIVDYKYQLIKLKQVIKNKYSNKITKFY